MLIFGSSAILNWFPDYPSTPKDTDYITNQIRPECQYTEYHWCDALQYVLDNNKDILYVDPDFLYTIKVSHLPWEGKNGKWFKHLKDAVFLQNKGCKLDLYLLEELQKEWCKRFGDKSEINLNKTSEDFFNKYVPRKYSHDFLHEHFKILDKPAYKMIQRNSCDVSVDKNLFDTLTEDQKLYTVLEEMQVIAFERGVSLTQAYKILVTKLSKGWWNLFCIVNAEKVLNGFKEEKLNFKKLQEVL